MFKEEPRGVNDGAFGRKGSAEPELPEIEAAVGSEVLKPGGAAACHKLLSPDMV